MLSMNLQSPHQVKYNIRCYDACVVESPRSRETGHLRRVVDTFKKVIGNQGERRHTHGPKKEREREEQVFGVKMRRKQGSLGDTGTVRIEAKRVYAKGEKKQQRRDQRDERDENKRGTASGCVRKKYNKSLLTQFSVSPFVRDCFSVRLLVATPSN